MTLTWTVARTLPTKAIAATEVNANNPIFRPVVIPRWKKAAAARAVTTTSAICARNKIITTIDNPKAGILRLNAKIDQTHKLTAKNSGASFPIPLVQKYMLGVRSM